MVAKVLERFFAGKPAPTIQHIFVPDQ